MGLCFYYLDEGNHYACRWRRSGNGEIRELLKVVDGVETTLAQEEAVAVSSEPMRVAVRLARGHISVTVDQQPAFEVFDVDLPHGKVGLLAHECPYVWFDNALVTFQTPPKALLSVHEVFSHEKSMQIWSGAESDWERKYQDVDGWGYPVNWHRAAFHGDLDVEVSAGVLGAGTKAVGLVVGADEPTPDVGYRLHATRRTGPWRVTLSEGGRPVVEKELAPELAPRLFRLRRVGRLCAAYVDGRCLMWRKSEAPMAGSKVGYYARGVEVERESVRILTKQVHNDLFRQAPSDWRLAAGTWTVTNRWECDPRWSFFSGVSSGRRPAAIWNKRRFSGDLVVEFYAGIKMDSSRGRRYEYARNMNLTICGDGQDLSSGYSFIFGGWQNSATCIARRGAVVAKTRSSTIPYRSNIHRRWFYIRAEKTGAKLTFYVDNQSVLTYTDTDAIGGGQFALWTYDCGIMVSRVRVSYQGDAPKELPPAEVAKPVKCIYDRIPSLGW